METGAQPEVWVQQGLEGDGDSSRRHQQRQEKEDGQERPVTLLPSDESTEQQADRCLDQPCADHQRECQPECVPGPWICQRLLPALGADKVDSTDSVPVGEGQHQYTDQRNKGKAEEHQQGRNGKDAQPTLCAAYRRDRLQRLGLSPGLRQRSEGGHVTSLWCCSWRTQTAPA